MIKKLLLATTILGSLTILAHGLGHKKPAYLDIQGFQQCLGHEARGEAMFWCMPAQMPAGCDPHAWEQLNKLPPKERVADCKHN